MTKKNLFIVGLHRSGTTALAKILASHKEISSFKNTGYPMDEGQFLQTVYPIGAVHGGPGKFGFDKNSHLTENSSLLTERNVKKLHEEWESLWDMKKNILLEKSPPNLIKMRFLQKIFPNSYFIVLLRHPIAVSYATQKWSKTSIINLLKHWVYCHLIAFEDLKYINNSLIIYYEDFFTNPEKELIKICNFLNINNQFDVSTLNSGINYNRKYFEKFHNEKHLFSITEKISLNLLKGKIKKFQYNLDSSKPYHNQGKYFEK